ncbi:hypothetical protein Cob_v003748 [Colletotrichum orbiculare MAFF 240422]|uniref:Uncharacterized protein n=1 Tax=Colletotrichum orbiculare (strain 104-T / ATCC 96160 / CBS 514.97 / LARS 414 / MAFF 240422) TaxID=1213857 RepID=N4W352_COLOR|nr:hypothetical protein Cob_v003748 [Colletotrichum orbiculare MAFF 240422]
MDAITQAILNRSKLEVELIKISQPTEDSFVMTIESKVSGTGPMGATMQPMTVDMMYNGGCFGKLNLPEVKTKSSGTLVVVTDQVIKIQDRNAFTAFVRAIKCDDELILRLDNGDCTIKALGLSAKVKYAKDVHIVGMKGPKISQVNSATRGGKFVNTMKVYNPSPLEIDHGVSIFELRNESGEPLAELKGDLRIVRGDFETTMEGSLKEGAKPSNKAVMVGLGTETKNWCDETIKNINCPFSITPQFSQMLQ